METRAYLMRDSQPRSLLSPSLENRLRRLFRPVLSYLAAGDSVYEEGADLSHWQGAVDWVQLRKKVKFAYIKATEGIGWVDDHYAVNMRDSAAPGFLRGSFHFLRPYYTGEQQLAHLIAAATKLAGTLGELPIMVDVEVPIPDKIVRDFVYATYEEYNYFPVIYCSWRTWVELVYGTPAAERSWAKACPLMVAGWDTTNPRIPPPWDKRTDNPKWDIHQYTVTNKGKEYGVSSTRLDLDRAKKSWLDKYRVPVPIPPPPVPPPPPIDEETDMSELSDKIKALIAEFGSPLPFQLQVNFNVAVGSGKPEPEPGPQPPPPPPPPPVPPANLRTFRVSEEAKKAVGYVVIGKNEKGKLMLDHPPTEERHVWWFGDPPRQSPLYHGKEQQVIGKRLNDEIDGDEDFVEVYGLKDAKGRTLYLCLCDGKLV